MQVSCGRGVPGTFKERQEGQGSWSEVGKGAGRRDDVKKVEWGQDV